MGEKNQKMAKNALIYSFFTLLQRGLGIFLLPVYTTVLSTTQLGIISTSTAVIAFFVIIFGFSLRGSTNYFFFNYKDDPEYLKRIFGVSVFSILSFSILGIVLLFIFKSFILDYLFEDIDFNPYVLLSMGCMFLQPLYFYYRALLKTKQLAERAVFLDLLYFVVMIGLTIVLILGFGFGAEGALIANMCASLIAFLISLNGLRKEIVLVFDYDIFKMLIKYSSPILPHNLSGWAMNMFDKVILNNLTSLSVVALFDVGSQIGKVVNMISLGVNSAYSPWFFDQIKNNPNGKEQIVKITNKILIFYGLCGIVVSWFSPEILKVISKPEYHESWRIVPIIATAFVINGFYFTFSNIFFLEKTKYLPLLTLTGAIFNIILNIVLIPRYGFFGAAYASLLTKILFTIIAFKVSHRLVKLNYNLILIVTVIIASFLLSCLPFIIQEEIFDEFSIFKSISLKIAIVAVLLIPFIYFYRKIILAYFKKN